MIDDATLGDILAYQHSCFRKKKLSKANLRINVVERSGTPMKFLNYWSTIVYDVE